MNFQRIFEDDINYTGELPREVPIRLDRLITDDERGRTDTEDLESRLCRCETNEDGSFPVYSDEAGLMEEGMQFPHVQAQVQRIHEVLRCSHSTACPEGDSSAASSWELQPQQQQQETQKEQQQRRGRKKQQQQQQAPPPPVLECPFCTSYRPEDGHGLYKHLTKRHLGEPVTEVAATTLRLAKRGVCPDVDCKGLRCSAPSGCAGSRSLRPNPCSCGCKEPPRPAGTNDFIRKPITRKRVYNYDKEGNEVKVDPFNSLPGGGGRARTNYAKRAARQREKKEQLGTQKLGRAHTF